MLDKIALGEVGTAGPPVNIVANTKNTGPSREPARVVR